MDGLILLAESGRVLLSNGGLEPREGRTFDVRSAGEATVEGFDEPATPYQAAPN
jgi:hypothetical protein